MPEFSPSHKQTNKQEYSGHFELFWSNVEDFSLGSAIGYAVTFKFVTFLDK